MKLYDQPLRKHASGLIHCSYDNLNKIFKERRHRGLEEHVTHKDNPLHPLIGKRLRHKAGGKEYTVRSSKRTWQWGFYNTLLLIDDNDSSINISWDLDKDSPSGDDMVIKHCKENQEDFITL